MPYSERQLHCMGAMGITPWVLRESATPAAAEALVEQTVESPTEPLPDVQAPATVQGIASASSPSNDNFLDCPLVAMPFRGAQHVQLGKAQSPLLILVEACANEQSQYPFEAADAKMFDDMLRAIAWQRQNVCLALMAYRAVESQNPIQNGEGAATATASVKDVMNKPRDAVLVFSHAIAPSSTLDDLCIELHDVEASIWRIPHPALLRREPELKRLAWTVLKAARAVIREV